MGDDPPEQGEQTTSRGRRHAGSWPSTGGAKGRFRSTGTYVSEYWQLTPGFYASVVAVTAGAIGLVLASTIWSESVVASTLSLGALTVGLLGVWFCRLNRKQQYYLDLVAREERELRKYEKLLFGTDDAEDALVDAFGSDDFEEGWAVKARETHARIEIAREQLAEAVHAVYREDYVTFLAAYYWANGQKVFVFELLDAIDRGSYDHHVDWTLEIDLPKLPGRRVHERGTIDVPTGDVTETRLWNLQKWLLSVKRSLPDAERAEVDEYLRVDGGEPGSSPTGQGLYRAVLVVQSWDIQRLSELMNIRRFLRYLIPLLLAVLFVTPLALWGAVDGGAPALSPENTGGGAASEAVLEFRFIAGVAVAGVLGALFSMAISVEDTSYTVTSYRSIPDPTVMREAIVVRLLVGGVAALVLFTILQSSIGETLFSADVQSNGLAVLIVAFLGGYSERLVKRSLEGAERTITSGDGENSQVGKRLTEKPAE